MEQTNADVKKVEALYDKLIAVIVAENPEDDVAVEATAGLLMFLCNATDVKSFEMQVSNRQEKLTYTADRASQDGKS